MQNEWITEADDQLQDISLEDTHKNPAGTATSSVIADTSILSATSGIGLGGLVSQDDVGFGSGNLDSSHSSSLNLSAIASAAHVSPPPMSPSLPTSSPLDEDKVDMIPPTAADNDIVKDNVDLGNDVSNINEVIEKEKTIEKVSELQDTLRQLLSRVRSTTESCEKTRAKNTVLKNYIENLKQNAVFKNNSGNTR